MVLLKNWNTCNEALHKNLEQFLARLGKHFFLGLCMQASIPIQELNYLLPIR